MAKKTFKNQILSTNETKLMNINEIIIDESSRLRSTGDITPIKDSIETLGFLINPITVDTDNNLITGYHRLRAFKELGKDKIPVRVIDKNINRELVEIDENLIRKNLSVLETAQQLLKRKEIYEELYPESKVESIRRNNFASVYIRESFTKDISKRIQKTQRWVQSYLEIGNKLSSESVMRIKGTPLEHNFILLKNISKKEASKQLETIELFLTTNKKDKQPKQLSNKYKIDFVLRKVVVNNKWVQLPEDYDIYNNSYNKMVEDMKNLETDN